MRSQNAFISLVVCDSFKHVPLNLTDSEERLNGSLLSQARLNVARWFVLESFLQDLSSKQLENNV